MEILKVTDDRFRKYGKVIKNIDFSSLVEAMKETPVPADVVYEPKIDCDIIVARTAAAKPLGIIIDRNALSFLLMPLMP